MSKSTEIEIKSPLVDIDDIKSLLAICQFIGESRTVDAYYDAPGRDLFMHGIFLRIRDNRKLEIKFNPNLTDLQHAVCDEYVFAWPVTTDDELRIRQFLGAYIPLGPSTSGNPLLDLGIQPFVTIKKLRKTYKADGVTICVDDVEGLGLFVEIEAVDSRGALAVAKHCKMAGLNNLAVGYVELHLRKTDFELYMKGRYLLQTDVA